MKRKPRIQGVPPILPGSTVIRGLSIPERIAVLEASQQVDNLADLFAKFPFHGLDVDFERDKDAGRDIAL